VPVSSPDKGIQEEGDANVFFITQCIVKLQPPTDGDC